MLAAVSWGFSALDLVVTLLPCRLDGDPASCDLEASSSPNIRGGGGISYPEFLGH